MALITLTPDELTVLRRSLTNTLEVLECDGFTEWGYDIPEFSSVLASVVAKVNAQ